MQAVCLLPDLVDSNRQDVFWETDDDAPQLKVSLDTQIVEFVGSNISVDKLPLRLVKNAPTISCMFDVQA